MTVQNGMLLGRRRARMLLMWLPQQGKFKAVEERLKSNRAEGRSTPAAAAARGIEKPWKKEGKIGKIS